MPVTLDRSWWRRYGPQAVVVVVCLVAIVLIRASRDEGDTRTATGVGTAEDGGSIAVRSGTIQIFGQDFEVGPGATGDGEGSDGVNRDDGTGSRDGGAGSDRGDGENSDGDAGGASGDGATGGSGGTTTGGTRRSGGTTGGGTDRGSGSGSGGTPGSTNTVVVTPIELEATLLTGEDVPNGWTLLAGVEGDPARITQGCTVPPEATQPNLVRQVTYRFGSAGPLFVQMVSNYADATAATAAFDTLRATLAQCIERGPTNGGSRLRPAQLNVGADQTAAASVSLDLQGTDVTGEVLFARVGQRIVAVSTLAPAEDDPKIGRAMMQRAVEKQDG